MVALAVASSLSDRDTDRIRDRYRKRSLGDPNRWRRKGMNFERSVQKNGAIERRR